MSASSFHPLIALLEVVKRLGFKRVKRFRDPRRGQPALYQGVKSHHRHRAFFELP